MFISGLNIFLSLAFITGGTVAVDYCSLPLCNDKHIACRNNASFAFDCPHDVQIVDLTPHRELILSLFNEVRDKVANGQFQPLPKAARMAQMQWCAELEYLASLNVRSCKLKQDKCRSTVHFVYAGQNTAIFGYSGLESRFSDAEIIKDRIEEWLSEGKHVTPDIINAYPATEPNPAVGHFTLAIAEKNTHVGCSAVRFVKDFYNHFIFVCNFATNNLIGRPVYTIAEVPASGCLNRYGASYEYPHLCYAKEVYDTDKI